MLARFFCTHIRFTIVNYLSSPLSSLSLKYQLHTTPSSSPYSPSPSNSSQNLPHTHFNLPLVTISLVSKSILSKYFTHPNPKVDSFSSHSLNKLLLGISHVSPEISRKFLRVSSLKPEHMLEILLGFQNLTLDTENVGSLWEIFKRVADKNVGYKHLPQSCEVMASMLVGAGMFNEVELLLSSMEYQGILLANNDVFSVIVKGYVSMGELDKAILLYDKMKDHCLVPTLPCYRALIDLLLKKHKVVKVVGIYEELIQLGFDFVHMETQNLEILIDLLCCDGKISEARKLVKKIVAIGWHPSAKVVNVIADIYCEKKDYEDLLSFFIEMKVLPGILVGNKIIFSLCSQFGVERAHLFLWELENLGFKPNEITFGILISWSCLKGKLRDAFVYLSEILHRGLRPDRHSYNTLISALFKAGLEQHTKDIFNEMIDNGIEPNLSTFRTLLAGYSFSRCFNEVKLMISEMVNRGLIVMSPLDDPISKAFSILGLTVKVKRDNNIKNFRTEYVDELGNGLYLDTNLDEFEKVVTGVLEESLVPDFNLLVTRQCDLKLVESALSLVDEMVHWGQELSVPALSVLIRLLCASKSHIKAIPSFLDKMSRPYTQLDSETLNLLLLSLGQKGFTEKCSLLVNEMNRKNLLITNATYTALLVNLCKFGTSCAIIHFWELARRGKWLPKWTDFVTILDLLCKRKMLKEVLELFNIMLVSNPDVGMQVFDMLVEKLCCAGFTCVAHILVDELQEQHFKLDHTVYSHLMKGFCQEKRFSEALTLFDTIQGDNLMMSSDVLSLLVPKLCNVGRIENAIALKNACLRDRSLNSRCVYSALIDGFCRAGNIAEANALFNEMILENVVPNDEIYNTLLQIHCKISNLKRVKELLCVMISRDITFTLSSYRDLIRLSCRNEMFLSALGLKRIMLVQSKLSCSIIYNLLIFYLFLMRNSSLVDSLLNDLKESGQQLDQVGYNFLIYGFSICKDMSRSMEYLNDVIFKGLRPCNRSLRLVIRYLCSNGQVEKAIQLSDLINSRGWIHCSTVQHALVECLLSHGSIHQAVKFLTEIMEKCSIPNSINYDNLIKKFCQCGRTETAVMLLDQMLKKKSIPDSTSYDYIVQSFCSYNNLNRAMDFYAEMLERELKPSIGTWDLLTEKLCATGQTPEAERLLNSVIDAGETPTWKMFYTVVERYRLEKNFSKASKLLHMMQKHGYKPDFQIQWSLISNLSNLNHREGVDTQGFLSKLLLDSGFSSENGAKSKL